MSSQEPQFMNRYIEIVVIIEGKIIPDTLKDIKRILEIQSAKGL